MSPRNAVAVESGPFDYQRLNCFGAVYCAKGKNSGQKKLQLRRETHPMRTMNNEIAGLSSPDTANDKVIYSVQCKTFCSVRGNSPACKGGKKY